MSALLRADPVEVRRAAAVLAQVDDEAAALARRLRQRPLACWASPSGRDYRSQLERLVQRLQALGRAYEQAGQAVLSYAVALADAQEQVARGTALQQSGAERSRAFQARSVPAAADGGAGRTPVVGPDVGAAQVVAGQRAVADAEQLERLAAARAAATLRQLAGQAPRVGRVDRGVQVVDDVVRTAIDGITGTPASLTALASAAWNALPGRSGEQQRAGRKVLRDAAAVWEQIPPLWEDLVGGRPGLSLGIFVLGPRQLLDGVPKPGGFLPGVFANDLRVLDVDEAIALAHVERPLRERILALRDAPPLSVEELLGQPFELARHEGGGVNGHTVLKHVGASDELLRGRRLIETVGTKGERKAIRSSFDDVPSAELAIRQALDAHADLLRKFAASPSPRITLPPTALATPLGRVVGFDDVVRPGTVVVVTVIKRPDGGVQVLTAYVDRIPRDFP